MEDKKSGGKGLSRPGRRFRSKEEVRGGRSSMPQAQMPVTNALAAWAKVLGKPMTYAPAHSRDQINSLEASGQVLQYELGYDPGISPTPMGTSNPDFHRSEHDIPEMRKNAQKNPNKRPLAKIGPGGVKEVTLEPNSAHAYLVDGTINGETLTFLVDTGATSVSIPVRIANYLGLKKEGRAHTVRTANGLVEVYETILDTLTIGNIELKWVKASINPSDDSQEILLGMSALKRLSFTYANEQLILRQEE